MTKTRKEHRCRHFTGIQNKTCEIGIEYESIKDKSGSPFRWICYEADSCVPCASFQPFTDEEIAEQERILDEWLKHMSAAMTKIKEINGKRRGVHGTIDCPKCGAPLHYSISSYNGHVHGKCETPGCVSWMQ